MGLLRKLANLIADSRPMPGFENHPRVGKLLSTAQREARLLNHHAVDVEHVLLALIATRLPEHGASLPEARQIVAKHLPHSNDPVRSPRLPLSVALHHVIDLAHNMRAARSMEQLQPELIWLALLEQEQQPIHKLIADCRIDEARLREELQAKLSSGRPANK